MSGYSQGGHATMAIDRALRNGDGPWRLGALAGPYDLSGTELPAVLHPTRNTPRSTWPTSSPRGSAARPRGAAEGRFVAVRFLVLGPLEPDERRRRQAVEELWTADGRHVLDPPEEARAAAARLGITGAAFEARGYDAIELRIATSYRNFIVEQGFTFRRSGEARRITDVVTFEWEGIQSLIGSRRR